MPRSGLVEALRAVKDESELEAIRRACAITDRVFERLADERFIGRTERDIAWTLEQLFHDEGAQGVGFEAVVASGPNAARPHARASDREIGRGETVVIDTRLHRRRLRVRLHAHVRDRPARRRAEGGVRRLPRWRRRRRSRASVPGLTGVAADALAREVVDGRASRARSGTASATASASRCTRRRACRRESTDTLVAGNVVTVEPGIYLPGRGGIRIEDDVVVTDDGIENLTALRKDLIEVD